MRHLVLPVVALVTVLGACGKPAAAGGGKGAGPKTFTVEVTPVVAREVAYVIDAVGAFETDEQVTITARVAGVVERVAVREGDTVAAGAVLAEIDPERYRLLVDAAKADLARAEADQAEARLGLQRRDKLEGARAGVVSGEELATWRSRVDLAAAALARAKADLGLAKLDLRHAQVAAPAAGEIRERLVQPGQQVQAGAAIATLLPAGALRVRCTVGEEEAARLRPGMILQAIPPGEAAVAATVTRIAGAVDARTRRVTVLADVAAADRARARPGGFARVRIPVGSAITPAVPQTAVRPSDKGFLAYVVEGAVAHERVIELGLRAEDGSVEVRSGLSAGELLVVRGAEALREGVAVNVVTGAGAGAGEKPSAESKPASTPASAASAEARR